MGLSNTSAGCDTWDFGFEMPVLKAAIEQLANGVVITDLQGVIRYANPAFVAMTGFTATEVVGQTPRIVSSGRQSHEFYSDLWGTIRNGAVWRGELINRRKDGGLYSEEMTIAPMRDSEGKPMGYVAIKDDVTERRASEEMLHLLASIVEHSNDAIVATTPSLLIQNFNHGATVLYGYRPEEVIGKPFSMLVPVEEWGRMWHTKEQLCSGESIAPFEGLALRKDDGQVPIDISLTAIRGRGDEIVSIASIIRDITPRRREEETRNLLASIVESSDDAIFAVSLDGIIMSWNKSAETLYGYTIEEAIGRPVSELIARQHLPEHTHLMDTLRTGQRITHHETTRTRKDGTEVDICITLSPIRNSAGVLIGGAAVVRDMTDKKRAQEIIRQSEEKYRTLVDNVPDIVWTADEAGQLTFLSTSIQTVSGYTAEELIGTMRWIEGVHPEDIDRVAATYRKVLETGELFCTDYRFRRKDGAWIWLQSRGVSIYERDGNRFVVGIASDVTVQKQAEEQLRKAKEMAEVASRVKSEFLSNMGHELRTPLNGILGFGALLQDSGLNDEQREFVDIVESQAKSLLQIINDVLDFSNIEAQKVLIMRGPFELHMAVQSVMRAIHPKACQKGLDLVCTFEGDVPQTVVGDSSRLRQVLEILADNAIKFTRQGQVTIATRCSAQTDAVLEIEFSVCDTGIGIESNKLQEIFRPFVQADMSSTRSFGGTGLGLAISSQLVKMMGGRMWVVSEAGKGSTFHFTLPFELC